MVLFKALDDWIMPAKMGYRKMIYNSIWLFTLLISSWSLGLISILAPGETEDCGTIFPCIFIGYRICYYTMF